MMVVMTANLMGRYLGLEWSNQRIMQVKLKILTNGLIHFDAVIILMYFEICVLKPSLY